jgi:hypothetical protein
VAVEGRVVELAQRQAVADRRLAERIGVGDDVGGVEQLLVALTSGACRFHAFRRPTLSRCIGSVPR